MKINDKVKRSLITQEYLSVALTMVDIRILLQVTIFNVLNVKLVYINHGWIYFFAVNGDDIL